MKVVPGRLGINTGVLYGFIGEKEWKKFQKCKKSLKCPQLVTQGTHRGDNRGMRTYINIYRMEWVPMVLDAKEKVMKV